MSVQAHAPATLANLGPGFDVLGLALDHPLDRVGASRRDEPGIGVRCTGRYGARVPVDPAKNLAAYTAQRVFDLAGAEGGLDLEVEKVIPPGSGLGSSAASAVAGAVATARLLGAELSEGQFLEITRDAEALATGTGHLDNVSAALLGGFVGVLSTEPPKVARLRLPGDWRIAVVLPHVEVKTADARAVLPASVPMGDAITNLRNLTGLLDAAERSDLAAFRAHLHDRLALPYRASLIPFLDAAREAAAGVGGAVLQVSGSGPALFAPCADEMTASQVCRAVEEALVDWHIDCTTYVSRAAGPGSLELD